ncbi:hypothetical protein DB31_8724 [Hyalangium minutum]|uniref:Uncharacterized protein n=1 Tax=Hyalangium minutum TaxID=394096 RepID=A0A085WI58_9BACT|nr:hypothetical protein DB31_8637 [Hyalangium minutum]KFE67371.1 hypothetical protein DB31_8724 [Hyalangium minutum]
MVLVGVMGFCSTAEARGGTGIAEGCFDLMDVIDLFSDVLVEWWRR